MTPPIFPIVAGSPIASALLGNSPVRFWPFGDAPASPVLPYGVWQLIGGAPENYLGEVPDVDAFSLQVDVYAATGASARDLAKALRDAIEPHAHIVGWRGESRDRDTRHYRISFDVDWIVQR